MTVRRMQCCCCGSDAGRWAQWWNRDTGYGICRRCIDWQRARGTDDAERGAGPGDEVLSHGAPP